MDGVKPHETTWVHTHNFALVVFILERSDWEAVYRLSCRNNYYVPCVRFQVAVPPLCYVFNFVFSSSSSLGAEPYHGMRNPIMGCGTLPWAWNPITGCETLSWGAESYQGARNPIMGCSILFWDFDNQELDCKYALRVN